MSTKQDLNARLDELGIQVNEKAGIACCKFSMPMRAMLEGQELSLELPKMNEDETHLFVPFRALSTIIIPDRWVDFAKPGVLKGGAKYLLGQTIYTNHKHDVNGWVGVVAKALFNETSNPNGIDSMLKVNKKWNERLIDGVKEGAIHSVSVDVFFDYEKSHKDLEDFWWLLGEKVEGDVVRIIATKIRSFSEISFVWQGADPTAKRIGLSKPEGALGAGNETLETPTGPQGSLEEGEENVKLARVLFEKLGLKPSAYGFKGSAAEMEFESEDVQRVMADMAGIAEENRVMAEALSKAEIDFSENLTEELSVLSAQAKDGKAYLEDVRTEALKFAKLANGEELSEALEKSIKNASLEDAKSFRDDFAKKAEEKFPASCTSCGAKLSRSGGSESPDSGDSFNAADFEL